MTLASICLNMIVKNESHIILNTLQNIFDHIKIDYWVISDTGSTDNTVEIIENFFLEKKIPGEMVFHKWLNFGENRNFALDACIGKSDYILFFDADDYFVGNFQLPELSLDTYQLQLSNSSENLRYLRTLIIKNDGNYKWRGVLHEFLEGPKNEKKGEITGDYYIVSGKEGSRNKDTEKYLKDARILETAFNECNDLDLLPRYAFYCAQSYRDFGLVNEAIYWYQKRIEIDSGWYDEKNYSYEQLGLLFEKQKNDKEALYYWQKGIVSDPNRAECWYHLARWNSWNNNFHLAYCLAKQASQIKKPDGNRLFLNNSIYTYWCLYEWCLNAFRLGEIDESYQVFKRLIIHCPTDLVIRLSPNIEKYKPYILNDSYSEVRQLSHYLGKSNKILEEILNI